MWPVLAASPADEAYNAETGEYVAEPTIPSYWDGLIDDVRIYNYGLTAEEVAMIYGSSVCIYSKDPLPSWLSVDLNEDCTVSLDDFAILAGEWLNGGVLYSVILQVY